jgi:4-carboxymuconolactone decarboxylase
MSRGLDGTTKRGFVLLALVLFVGVSRYSDAQTRMPPIPADKLTEAQKLAFEDFRSVRGREPYGPFIAELRSPEIIKLLSRLGDYTRFKTALSLRLTELVIIMTARHATQEYVWHSHYGIAVKAGLDPAIIKAIGERRRPELDEEAQIVYDFCTELFTAETVSDATYARAVSKFGEKGIIDMLGIVGYFSFQALILDTVRFPAPKSDAPAMVSGPG